VLHSACTGDRTAADVICKSPYTLKGTGTSQKTQCRSRDLPAKDAVSDMSFARPVCPGAESATAATVVELQ